jgi:hypothetical protein
MRNGRSGAWRGGIDRGQQSIPDWKLAGAMRSRRSWLSGEIILTQGLLKLTLDAFSEIKLVVPAWHRYPPRFATICRVDVRLFERIK